MGVCSSSFMHPSKKYSKLHTRHIPEIIVQHFGDMLVSILYYRLTFGRYCKGQVGNKASTGSMAEEQTRKPMHASIVRYESNLRVAANKDQKVSSYYISRGQAKYFEGQVSQAHVDYRRALELDPENAEARRLCRQFDSKGKLTERPINRGTAPMVRPPQRSSRAKSRSNPGRTTAREEETSASARATANGEVVPATDHCPPPSTSFSSPPAHRRLSLCGQQRQRPDISLSGPGSSTTTTSSNSPCSCRCQGCCRGGASPVPPPMVLSISRSRVSGKGACSGGGGAGRGGVVRYRQRGSKGLLPKVDTRPPREPEWGEQAISSAKSSDDHVRRVFSERTGAVPVRDEVLWGMLRACPKSWAAAVGGGGGGDGGGSVFSARLSLGSSLSAAGKSVMAGSYHGGGRGKEQRKRAINTAAVQMRPAGGRAWGREGEEMLGIIGNGEVVGLEQGV